MDTTAETGRVAWNPHRPKGKLQAGSKAQGPLGG